MKRLLLAVLLFTTMVCSAYAAFHQLKYRGTIAGNRVEVAFSYNTGDYGTNFQPYWIDDSYCRYTKYPDCILTLRHKSSPSSKFWIMNEYDGGRYTGKWKVRQTKNGLVGTFTSAKGKVYKVNLTFVEDYDTWDWAY